MKRDSVKNHDEARMKKKKEQRENTLFRFLIILIIIIILCLFFRSCRARDKPAPKPDRIYEEDYTIISKPDKEVSVSAEDTAKRLNLAVAKEYHISDEEPLFYISYPEDNVYDVVFTLKDTKGSVLYQTSYVAPGTNVAVVGTAFLEKGKQEINCAVGVYSRDSGRLLSDCMTVVLDICYE